MAIQVRLVLVTLCSLCSWHISSRDGTVVHCFLIWDTTPHNSLYFADLYEPTKPNLNGQSKGTLNDKSDTIVASVTFCFVLQKLCGI